MKKALLLFSSAGLILLALAGFIAIGWQFRNGLWVTAMGEPVVWGLYVVGFAYFLGLGSGALTVAAASLASGRAEFRWTSLIASPLALVSLGLAGAMITIDLGRPERAWMMALKAQVQSPLVIDFLVLNLMLLAAFVLTYYNLRYAVTKHGIALNRMSSLIFAAGLGSGAERRMDKLVKIIAAAAVFLTPALYLMTVRVFSSLQARPGWHNSLLAPSFLVSAMLSGVSAVGLAMILSDSRFTANPLAVIWRRAVAILAVASVVLFASPFITMQQFSSTAAAGNVDIGLAVLLYEIGLGLLLPLILLSVARQNRLLSGISCVLLLFGVFVKRWHVISTGMILRSLPLEHGLYRPNLIEITAFVGLLSAGVLVLVALHVIFGLDSAERSGSACAGA